MQWEWDLYIALYMFHRFHNRLIFFMFCWSSGLWTNAAQGKREGKGRYEWSKLNICLAWFWMECKLGFIDNKTLKVLLVQMNAHFMLLGHSSPLWRCFWGTYRSPAWRDPEGAKNCIVGVKNQISNVKC